MKLYAVNFSRRAAELFPKADLPGWRRGLVVRASVSDWRTFPVYVPDLWLTCDHFVGKASAMGQPTRPTQPPTLSGK